MCAAKFSYYAYKHIEAAMERVNKYYTREYQALAQSY